MLVSRPVNIRFPEELARRVDVDAERSGAESFSEHVRALLAEALDARDEERAHADELLANSGEAR